MNSTVDMSLRENAEDLIEALLADDKSGVHDGLLNYWWYSSDTGEGYPIVVMQSWGRSGGLSVVLLWPSIDVMNEHTDAMKQANDALKQMLHRDDCYVSHAMMVEDNRPKD